MTAALVVYALAVLGVFIAASDAWVPGDGPWPIVWAVFWPVGVVVSILAIASDWFEEKRRQRESARRGGR